MRNYLGVHVHLKVYTPAGFAWIPYKVTYQQGYNKKRRSDSGHLTVTIELLEGVYPAPTIISMPRRVFETSGNIKIPPEIK